MFWFSIIALIVGAILKDNKDEVWADFGKVAYWVGLILLIIMSILWLLMFAGIFTLASLA